MSKSILVANWKNHPASLEETNHLLAGLSRKAALYKRLLTIIAPPAPFLDSVARKTAKFALLGAQDIFSEEAGTHTGVITSDILQSFGVRAVIVGHSERRALGETDEQVAQKVKVALKAGLAPILCVGEVERDRDGVFFEFIRAELKASLETVKRKEDATKLVIAYEPIWAIGKKAKDAMQPGDLAQMTIFIKKVLTEIFGRDVAERIPIIYGGAVAPQNVAELAATGVRGFLIGHESLIARNFAQIAEALI